MGFIKIEITYPVMEKRRLQRKKILKIMRWPLLIAAYTCPIVNIVTKGKAWSVVVLMSLYMVWTLVFSTDLVEYNRISQFIKLITNSCVLLVLIDVFLVSGWAMEVVPIVCFSGVAISGILFFTDFDRQKQNMMPMLQLIVLEIIGAIIGIFWWRIESNWAMVVMGVLAFAMLIACIAVLSGEFIRELKRRFHVK